MRAMRLRDNAERKTQHVGNENVEDERQAERKIRLAFLEVHRLTDDPLNEFDDPLHEVLKLAGILDRQVPHG